MNRIVVEAIEIPAAGELDAIQVYWRDVGLGQGYVTITCWGSAWTCYFGGMGGRTIRQFFADCDKHYLVTKLGITQHLKQRKSDHAYLGRLIDAVHAAMAKGESLDEKTT